jgi:uncharacterized protein (DUF305 family)
MTRKTLVGTALAVLTLGAVLIGCSANSAGTATPAASAPASPADTPRAGHNQADVTFARAMIPHHVQALEMATLVPDRTSNPQVLDLANRIQRAQDPEIQRMTSWLTAWEAAPATSDAAGTAMPSAPSDHSSGHAMPDMPGHHAMVGMMSDADMARLHAARGGDFDRMWLRMMIQHHQGAIEMAKTELAQGANPDARTLAQQIIDGQQAEITQMNGLLGQS